MPRRTPWAPSPALIAALLLAIFATGCPGLAGAPAAPAAAPRRAVLVLLDGVNVEDLASANLPNFRRLLVQRGAIAAANVRAVGQYLPESGYVSLGAGTRALGGPASGLVLSADELYQDEPSGTVFARNTGVTPPPGSLVALGLPELLELNGDADHPIVPGGLGQALRESGHSVALLGSADGADGPSRLAGTVAMDERGIVPAGSVAPELLLADPRFPTGRRTNYARLLEEFRALYARNDLVVVETGDTARLNRSAAWLTTDQTVRMRRLSLQRFDAFLADLAQAVDWDRTLVLVTAPSPSRTAVAGSNFLTFVAAFGPALKPGLLTSPSTRRPGLVTEADVTASLLGWLKAAPLPSMAGRPVASIPFTAPLPALGSFVRKAVITYSERPPVLKGYVVLQIIFILASIGALFLAPRLPKGAASALRASLLWLTAVPAALLLQPLVQTGELVADLALLIVLTALLVLVARLLSRHLHGAFPLVYLASVALVMADLALGARLARSSILGFDPMSGARYYGLGNEYEGAVFGATVMGCAALLERWPALRRWWMPVTLLPLGIVTLLAGLDRYGADFGGLIVGAVTLVAAWFSFRGEPVRARHLWTLFGLGLAGVAAVLALDILRPSGATSHIGVLARQVAANGPSVLLDVISRKLAMNLRLMRYTPWADVLLAFIVGLGVLFYRPVGLLRRLIAENPWFTKGMWAALAGTVTAFVVNDSGVVAAATFMLYPVALLLDLALRDTFFPDR